MIRDGSEIIVRGTRLQCLCHLRCFPVPSSDGISELSFTTVHVVFEKQPQLVPVRISFCGFFCASACLLPRYVQAGRSRWAAARVDQTSPVECRMASSRQTLRNPGQGQRHFVLSLRPQRKKAGNRLISSSLASKTAIHQIQLQAGKEMGFSIHINGNAQAVVTKVVTGGAADMAGVRTGSLLASVDGKNILETSMSHSDVLELITRPARHCNIRTFGFVQPMHEGAQRTPCDWHVPAFKGDIGRVHVSQRHKVEHLTRPRRAFDIGDENPEAILCA